MVLPLTQVKKVWETSNVLGLRWFLVPPPEIVFCLFVSFHSHTPQPHRSSQCIRGFRVCCSPLSVVRPSFFKEKKDPGKVSCLFHKGSWFPPLSLYHWGRLLLDNHPAPIFLVNIGEEGPMSRHGSSLREWHLDVIYSHSGPPLIFSNSLLKKFMILSVKFFLSVGREQHSFQLSTSWLETRNSNIHFWIASCSRL